MVFRNGFDERYLDKKSSKVAVVYVKCFEYIPKEVKEIPGAHRR